VFVEHTLASPRRGVCLWSTRLRLHGDRVFFIGDRVNTKSSPMERGVG
jgi:hypothetical protein